MSWLTTCPICQASTKGVPAVLLKPATRDQFICVRGPEFLMYVCLDCHTALCRFPALMNDAFAGMERAA